MKTKGILRLVLLASVVFWLIMVLSDFDVLFSSLRGIDPGIPRLLPNILLDLFTGCVIYFFHLRIGRDQRLDFTDLLWQVFALGLIATLISLGTRLIVLATGQSALGTKILFNYIIYQINFSVFLGFVVGTFMAWKRLITYQREKQMVRLWTVFEFGLLFVLIHDSLGIRINSVVLILVVIGLAVIILLLSVRMKWVAYLNFRQKLSSLALVLMINFYLAYFTYTVQSMSNAVRNVSQSFLFFEVHAFNIVMVVFAIVYGVVAFLIIMGNLPTSSAFEQKQEESLQFQRLSQSIRTGEDESSVYPLLLESAVKSLSAEAAWLDLRDSDAEKKLYTYQVGEQEVGRINRMLDERAISFVPENASYKFINLSRLIRDDDTLFRSLLVCPLQVDGKAIGFVCVLKEVSQGFTQEMASVLSRLAGQAAISIENFRLLDQVVQGERYKEELKIAKAVQQSLLPSRLEKGDFVDIDGSSESADEVGGDYFDTVRLAPHRIAAIVADVSGKGTSAAFHMSQMKGIFHSLAQVTPEPYDFLMRANRALASCLEKGSFISAVYFVIDQDKRSVTYARAGHCPVLFYHATNNSADYLTDKGSALGMIRNNGYEQTLQPQEVQATEGDIMVLFTDGISEARNEAGEEFGYERLKTALLHAANEPTAAEIRKSIIAELYAFTAKREIDDDHTILVVRFGGPQNPLHQSSVS